MIVSTSAEWTENISPVVRMLDAPNEQRGLEQDYHCMFATMTAFDVKEENQRSMEMNSFTVEQEKLQ